MGKQSGSHSLNPRQREGRYANYFEVGHNAHEFVIDCGQFHENDPLSAYLHTRIITNPASAKGFLTILTESVDQYEKQFGVMVLPEMDGSPKH
jgi:hypothetical protein